MTTKRANFEGFANGGTLVAGSANAGDPLDTVSVPAGGASATASSAAAVNGSRGAVLAVGTTAAGCWVSYTLNDGTGSATSHSTLAWPAIASLAQAAAILRGMNAADNGQRWRVTMTTAGILQLRDGPSNALLASSTGAYLGATRIETEIGGSVTAANNTAELRIYQPPNSTTPVETLTVAGFPSGGPTAIVRAGLAAASGTNNSFPIDDFGASDTAPLGPAIPLAQVEFNWAGALTASGATVSYGLKNVASARLVVSTTADLATSPAYSTAGAPDAYGLIKRSVTGLMSNTHYYYGIEGDGTLLADGRGEFSTFPAAGSHSSGTFPFGTCTMTNSNADTFTAIRDHTGPWGLGRFFSLLGDLHYRDFGAPAQTQPASPAAVAGEFSIAAEPGVAPALSEVIDQYKASLMQPNMAAMLAKIAMIYGWDNHDFGGPDSDSLSPARDVMAQAYRMVAPHYPLPATDGVGIWQSFVYGRIRFILLDTRSQRSPRTDPESAAKSMLGAEQKAWFKQELLAAEPLKIILSGIYWRRDSSTGDRWGSYGTEWTEIRQFIQGNNVRAYVLSGDRHALYADDGSSANAYLPNVSGAPLDQGSTQSFEPWSHGYFDTGGTNMRAYGVIDIADNDSAIDVDYAGRTSDGTTRVTMSTQFVPAATLDGGWGFVV